MICRDEHRAGLIGAKVGSKLAADSYFSWNVTDNCEHAHQDSSIHTASYSTLSAPREANISEIMLVVSACFTRYGKSG
ncbi:hypothetical protein [Endozoicomonas elysicola]|uniref:Uncharacterized protein n=1 Tax=Endozoicomonas elysicola TaxID=305900 RepID=A0A081KAK5_9GAMM|nr:hypothetical protein [Endozoicomonas elysicola]KEI71181.1 hypothetical protein GV64_10890 [Endozoicomonas elysicola]